MSEYPRRSVARSPDLLTIGTNQIHWSENELRIDVRDRLTRFGGSLNPFGEAIEGTIRVIPRALNRRAFALDMPAKHTWWPVAPESDIEVSLNGQYFCGTAYFDTNWGREPLERGFRGWNWSRSKIANRTVVHYVTDADDGSRHALALEFDADGDARDRACGPQRALARSNWGIRREVVSDSNAPVISEVMEDTPFYARQRVAHEIDGQTVEAIHESLDLRRFDSRAVQHLLTYKTRRVG
ncbi:MAG: hydroxyneurosporene dehydrogenase [Myxococcota bacterium]